MAVAVWGGRGGVREEGARKTWWNEWKGCRVLPKVLMKELTAWLIKVLRGNLGKVPP